MSSWENNSRVNQPWFCIFMVETKFYRPLQYNQYKAGLNQHHDQGKPTSRHKNHCAYVTEKTVSFTVQDGAAPYVKAEYNKCTRGQKCPTLMYRLLYKPLFKVAHKTVTELEWRCCPGYSGYGCMEGPPVYQHPMKMMPPFKGPPMKGPQFKGPQFKGPMYKGPMFKGPMFKGPPINAAVKANPWSQAKGPPTGSFNYQMREHLEAETTGQALDTETDERIYRMEEDVRRLNMGLETLRATVNGLEDSLRASLREDANRMLSALFSAAPGPVHAPAVASNPSTVGFAEIPGGDAGSEGLDGRQVFTGLTELNGRVEELRAEMQAKTVELLELKATVMGHDGQLKKVPDRARAVSNSTDNFAPGANGKDDGCQAECSQDRNPRPQPVPGHLRVELGGHKDHIEGMMEGRLAYVEEKLNLTWQMQSDETGRRSVPHRNETGPGLETRVEGKLRALEGRLLMALEELSNATAPGLLEGHAVPALETELDSIRERIEVDVDRVQKHLSKLEIRCSSSCSSPQSPSAIQGDSAVPSAEEESVKEVLDVQEDRLNTFNVTLQNILRRLSVREQQEQAEADAPTQGELTILKFNVRSVNRTLRVIQSSLGTVVHQVGQANSSWHEREARLAQQIKGVVHLVGHQASMLGAGERRLTRLKGELHEMKRRLADEVQGCRSTAMGVQKEVTVVEGRVTSVEDQCKGLNYMAEDLERIREELEKQSNGLLLQVNGTLTSHAQQLTELRGEVRNCTEKAEPAPPSIELESQPRRGDTFTLN
ncbi:unnamed protein product [Pleuronectes platessa]|uniref:EMI domain-containing protein n=1 Tax=Pleuronectes platessa TaxID=8262 RepID=A0A9N7Z9T7_PLEPL|nr:unnamed protein product [Pleuronectes platessa]